MKIHESVAWSSICLKRKAFGNCGFSFASHNKEQLRLDQIVVRLSWKEIGGDNSSEEDKEDFEEEEEDSDEEEL